MHTNEYIEELLSPVSEESPSGIDVAYDPDYLKLEAMLPDSTETMLETTEVASTDWSGIRRSAEGILKRSKHLPTAVYLTVSLVEYRGLTGLRDGICIVGGLLEQYWDAFWPRIDEEDPDPTERINILTTLSPPLGAYGDQIEFTKHVLQMPIVKGQQTGTLTLRAINGTGTIGENEADATVVLPDADPDAIEEACQAAQDCVDAIDQMVAMVTARTDGNGVLDLDVLQGQLKDIHKALASHLGQEVESDDTANETSADAGSGGTGAIRSRSDVVATIDRLTSWYDQNEPGSPIPLLLNRVRDMVHMRFPELMNQIFPDAVEGSRLLVHEPESQFDSSE
jgi:type VI secretion system protein ImpA